MRVHALHMYHAKSRRFDDDAADDDFRIVIDRSNFHNMHEKSTLQQVLSIGLQTALRPMYTTIMNSY